MKILTTISYYRPYISGLTICAQRLIEGLSNEGFEFTVLTSRHDKLLPKMERKRRISILRQTVIFTVGKVPVMPGYLLRLIKELRRADLVWIHLPQAEGLITAIAARVFGKRLVATLHCLPLLPSGWQRFLFQRVFDLINNLTIWLVDRVVYYTKDYAENTPELWHFPQKSRYILPPIIIAPHYAYLRPWSTSTLRKSASAGFGRTSGFFPQKKSGCVRIGFAGRLAEDKGLEYLISALQLMKVGGNDARLIIAGSKDAVGESRYAKKTFSLIDESGVEVEFLGVIEPEKMSDFYKLIDVLVLPSVNRTEAFGMVQAEAMKYGVPVLASDLPGVRIPVQLTSAGQLVPPKNPVALAKAIIHIYRHSPDKTKISRPARRVFSTHQSLSQYSKIFKNLRHLVLTSSNPCEVFVND